MAHPENWTAKTRTERDEEIIRRLLATDESAKALEIAKARCDRQVWIADDGNAEMEYETDTRRGAAREYVADGDYGDYGDNKTDWITVYTWPRYYVGEEYVDDEDDRSSHGVEIEPKVPDCAEGHDHDWCSPLSVVGGIKENPGCWGHGGGVIYCEVCRHCGCERVTDTWAQRHDTGEQGLTSVEYIELGEHDHSDAWREWRIARMADALERAGYYGVNRGDSLLIAATDSGTDENGDEDPAALATMDAIRAVVEPMGGRAEWTGSSNTDAYGASTSDVCVELED